MDFDSMIMKVHENAVQHGWWDTPRTSGETVALINSEFSEALEEYRARRGMVWFGDGLKPEGIAVELIDGIIRIMDLCGAIGFKFGWTDPEGLNAEVRRCIKYGTVEPYADLPLPETVALLQKLTCEAFSGTYGEEIDAFTTDVMTAEAHGFINFGAMIQTVATAATWIFKNGQDPDSLLHIKHDYNVKRPYRHGNKAL